jgi:hypothetical protein
MSIEHVPPPDKSVPIVGAVNVFGVLTKETIDYVIAARREKYGVPMPGQPGDYAVATDAPIYRPEQQTPVYDDLES